LDLETAIGEFGDDHLGGFGIIFDQKNPRHDPAPTFCEAFRPAAEEHGLGGPERHVQRPPALNARRRASLP
jgi:hypothetical protein